MTAKTNDSEFSLMNKVKHMRKMNLQKQKKSTKMKYGEMFLGDEAK